MDSEPESPKATANYMANRAPKLATLAKIFLQVKTRPEFEGCRQLVIVCDWPMVSFVVTLFFLLLNVRCECIRASHEDEQRQKITNHFNNPEHPLRVLISIHKLIEFGENLQNNCNAIIIVEADSGLSTEIQDCEWIHRLRQTKI